MLELGCSLVFKFTFVMFRIMDRIRKKVRVKIRAMSIARTVPNIRLTSHLKTQWVLIFKSVPS